MASSDTPDGTHLHLADIEAAINWWLARAPVVDGVSLSPDVAPLADLYARLIHAGVDRWPVADVTAEAMMAWLDWYASTPDAPCIAICSTSQGDEICKGCGRSFDEVQHWIAMTPVAKRDVWRRITVEGTAWRFTHYADRVAPNPALRSATRIRLITSN